MGFSHFIMNLRKQFTFAATVFEHFNFLFLWEVCFANLQFFHNLIKSCKTTLENHIFNKEILYTINRSLGHYLHNDRQIKFSVSIAAICKQNFKKIVSYPVSYSYCIECKMNCWINHYIIFSYHYILWLFVKYIINRIKQILL